MIRTQIYLPEELHRDLMILSKAEGKNFSSLVREGVAEVIKKKRSKRRKNFGKDFFGALKKGPKDISSRIDDIYK